MESGGVSLEDLEEYYMVVNQTFRSEEEGYKYYNSYALLKGFGVRKEDLERKPDTNIAFRRLFSCSKEGYRAVKHFNATNRKRQPRALSRCGCKARLEIELHMESGEWFVKIFVDEHNHPLAKLDHTAFIRSHRGLSDAQKADVIEYGIGGLRTHQIMEIMEKQHGGYDKVGFVSRDLYNFVGKYKKERIEGRDAEFVLNYMSARKNRDGEFFYKYKTDEEGHLQNLFWTDAQSRIDYDAFGGVVVFDSTYRVNKYNLPFVPFIGVNHHRSTTVFGCGIVSDETVASYVWLLKAFLEATQQNPPRSVMTDGDRAMAKAISMVFPGTDHRLCSWHIEQNMIRHLRNPKLGDFRKFVYHAMKVDDFERRWVEFKEKYEITEKDEWINRMYELRKKWSKAYTKGRYFLGMQSNQRSESLNSRLHKNLDRRMSLVDLLEHYDLCLSRIRRNESQLDAEASQTVPFTDLHAEPLERSAARTYTPEMFKRVKVEIIRLVEWEIAEVTRHDGLSRYVVCLKRRTHVKYDVRFSFVGPLLKSVSCPCLKFDSEDIPCTHIFSVLKYLGLLTIPSCCVKQRWTMKAKPAFVADKDGNLHEWSERMNRYHELRNMASLHLFKASRSIEVSKRVIDFLQTISDEEMEDDSDEAARVGPFPPYFSGSNQAATHTVLDPKPIKSKGAPSKKRWKPFHETFLANQKRQK